MSGKSCPLGIAGRYIRLTYHAAQAHQTLRNVYSTLLNPYGNPMDSGDLDAAMSRLKID